MSVILGIDIDLSNQENRKAMLETLSTLIKMIEEVEIREREGK